MCSPLGRKPFLHYKILKYDNLFFNLFIVYACLSFFFQLCKWWIVYNPSDYILNLECKLFGVECLFTYYIAKYLLSNIDLCHLGIYDIYVFCYLVVSFNLMNIATLFGIRYQEYKSKCPITLWKSSAITFYLMPNIKVWTSSISPFLFSPTHCTILAF